MIEELLLNSINNPIIIGIMIYSYLMYTLFLKDGKFRIISDLEELFKVGFIFVGVFLLTLPLLVYLPATINFLQGKPLPVRGYFELPGLLVVAVIFTFLPWLIKNSSNDFNIKTWFNIINFLNTISFILLIFGIVISYIPGLGLEFFRLPSMAMAIIFFVVIIIESVYIRFLPRMLNIKDILEEEKQKHKNKQNTIINMKESFWKKLWKKSWEPEDSRLFGELFMILGGFLIIKWAETIIPVFIGKDWLYFGIGFLFILYGVKLLRKEDK